MKFKAVLKAEAAEIVSQAVNSVLRDGGNEKATIKLSPTRYAGQMLLLFDSRPDSILL